MNGGFVLGILFGTDGVRGIANRELTPELAYQLGRAGSYVLLRNFPTPYPGRKDTRVSGDMLEAALVAGICSMGASVLEPGWYRLRGSLFNQEVPGIQWGWLYQHPITLWNTMGSNSSVPLDISFPMPSKMKLRNWYCRGGHSGQAGGE